MSGKYDAGCDWNILVQAAIGIFWWRLWLENSMIQFLYEITDLIEREKIILDFFELDLSFRLHKKSFQNL